MPVSTEGTVTATGCAPWGTGSACQEAINQNDWCTNYQADAPSVTVTYNAAATLGITVTSNKSLIGSGSKGVIKGRGLRVVSGASNVIIQNIEITNLNPKYVWGGDAITLNNCDLVWIDHVTVSQRFFSSSRSNPHPYLRTSPIPLYIPQKDRHKTHTPPPFHRSPKSAANKSSSAPRPTPA